MGFGNRGVIGDKWSSRILWLCAIGSAIGLYMVAVERQSQNRAKMMAKHWEMQVQMFGLHPFRAESYSSDLVELGEAMGIIVGPSSQEQDTQLTLRTLHHECPEHEYNMAVEFGAL